MTFFQNLFRIGVPENQRKVEFTPEEKLQFVEKGFVIKSNLIPDQLRFAALRAINFSLGQSLQGKDPVEKLPADHFARKIPKHISECRELLDKPETTDVIPLIQSLVGPIHGVGFGQIAMRYPGFGCLGPEHLTEYNNSGAIKKFMIRKGFLEKWTEKTKEELSGAVDFSGQPSKPSLLVSSFDERFIAPPAEEWAKSWHVDGWDEEAHVKGKLDDFTMLVGVLLSELPGDYYGNFTAYPGSHRAMMYALQALGGPNKIFQHARQQPADQNPLATLVKKVSPFLNKPEQIHAKAGDVLFVHYQVAHTIAPNISSDIRYIVFFRVNARDHTGYRPEAMTDCWLEYHGIRDLATAYEHANPPHPGLLALSLVEPLPEPPGQLTPPPYPGPGRPAPQPAAVAPSYPSHAPPAHPAFQANQTPPAYQFPFRPQLETLRGMGFTGVNVPQLLVQFNGDVNRVIEVLVQ